MFLFIEAITLYRKLQDKLFYNQHEDILYYYMIYAY